MGSVEGVAYGYIIEGQLPILELQCRAEKFP